MGQSPILSISHTVTINTMLNSSGVNNGHGLETLRVKRSSDSVGDAGFGDKLQGSPWITLGCPDWWLFVTKYVTCNIFS